MAKSITIGTIAQELNLSKSTISRVLNKVPNSGISAATRNRVLSSVKKNGYVANSAARSLATGKTNLIAALIIDPTNPFAGGFVRSIEDVAVEKSFHLLLASTRGLDSKEMSELTMLRQRGVEGVIIEHFGNVEMLNNLADEGFPFVLLDICPQNPTLDYVTFDDFEGGLIACQAFIGKGRKRIAHIAGPREYPCSGRRMSGYLAAINQSGIKYNPELVIQVENNIDVNSGYDAFSKIVKYKPDAVFCFDDHLAVGVLKYARDNNLKVPEDLAIIGCGDREFCELASVPIASIKLDTKILGLEAATILFEKIEGKTGRSHPRKIVPYLVQRESFG